MKSINSINFRKSLKSSLEHFIKQNEELKAKNMTYYEKYEQAQKNQQLFKVPSIS